ncbi:FAD-dependent oxidoreductase [Nocardioides convexus]|uniref:FAD-dependent oxidoreductase n=1 Tax=Nocardioides convexus TaxID=2712224 RepID=UPI002418A891|nr:FAD-dependent oxidoreductase [Nocardioides convexus]
MLAAHGFVLSAHTMLDDAVDAASLDAEPAHPGRAEPEPMSRITAGLAGAPTDVDLVVIGLGVTGAGVALDAVSRGLSVLAVDAHDLAFGTSRWSSKARPRRPALPRLRPGRHRPRERRGARHPDGPHRAAPDPPAAVADPAGRRGQQADGRARRCRLRRRRPAAAGGRDQQGHAAPAAPAERRGDPAAGPAPAHRRPARRSSRLGRTDSRTTPGWSPRSPAPPPSAAPPCTPGPGWSRRRGPGCSLRDEPDRSPAHRHGANRRQRRRRVGRRPGRGRPAAALPRHPPGAARRGPARSHGRGVRAHPGRDQPLRAGAPPARRPVYVGLTDEPVEGPVPDVAAPTEVEIGFLLDVVSASFARPLRRSDVVGAFAGLRPLLDSGEGSTADLSRKHAVLTSPTGVVTIVGGKARRPTAGWPRTPWTPPSPTPDFPPGRASPRPSRWPAPRRARHSPSRPPGPAPPAGPASSGGTAPTPTSC